MSSISGNGCMLMIMRVLSDLTWLPLLGGGESHGILYYTLNGRVWLFLPQVTLRIAIWNQPHPSWWVRLLYRLMVPCTGTQSVGKAAVVGNNCSTVYQYSAVAPDLITKAGVGVNDYVPLFPCNLLVLQLQELLQLGPSNELVSICRQCWNWRKFSNLKNRWNCLLFFPPFIITCNFI